MLARKCCLGKCENYFTMKILIKTNKIYNRRKTLELPRKCPLHHSHNSILCHTVRFYCSGFSRNERSGKLNGLSQLSSNVSYKDYSDKIQLIFYDMQLSYFNILRVLIFVISIWVCMSVSLVRFYIQGVVHNREKCANRGTHIR